MLLNIDALDSPPQQKVIWSKMSTVLTLRNIFLDEEKFGKMAILRFLSSIVRSRLCFPPEKTCKMEDSSSKGRELHVKNKSRY